MILVDVQGNVYQDKGAQATEGMIAALKKNGAVVERLNDDILYRFDVKGGLAIYYIGGEKIVPVRLMPTDLAWFGKLGQVVTKTFVCRDIGMETTKFYLDDISFDVPTELLLR